MATRAAWSKIEVGSTCDQVRELVGPPDRIKPRAEGLSVWKYGHWPLNATVTFRGGHVVGLKLPFRQRGPAGFRDAVPGSEPSVEVSLPKVNDDTFEAEVENFPGTVLVHFGAKWAPPSRLSLPIIAEVAAEVAGHAKVVCLDVDESPKLAARFSIVNVPTIIFFKNGQEAMRLVGILPREVILEHIERLGE